VTIHLARHERYEPELIRLSTRALDPESPTSPPRAPPQDLAIGKGGVASDHAARRLEQRHHC
jgi:hypothetical protein